VAADVIVAVGGASVLKIGSLRLKMSNSPPTTAIAQLRPQTAAAGADIDECNFLSASNAARRMSS